MSWYSHPDVKFARVDGIIQPISKSNTKIPKGTVLFYEIPALSTEDFKLDTIRYTMQCVYSGEAVFPCAFNTEIDQITEEGLRWRVFFDYAFKNDFRRKVADKLALSLINQSVKPFFFKALGIFAVDKENFNCQRVSYMNGETYLVASKDICSQEVINRSEDFIVPGMKDDKYKQMEVMSMIDLDRVDLLQNILKTRELAEKVRPDCNVFRVNSKLDTNLEERMNKYQVEKHLGFTKIKEGVHRLTHTEAELTTEEEMEKMGEMMDRLMEKELKNLEISG